MCTQRQPTSLSLSPSSFFLSSSPSSRAELDKSKVNAFVVVRSFTTSSTLMCVQSILVLLLPLLNSFILLLLRLLLLLCL